MPRSKTDILLGYGFYVLEDHKGLIGGLFVSVAKFREWPNH